MGYGGSCVIHFINHRWSFLLLLKTIGKDTHIECLFFRAK
ncbi:hypothetical protein C621_0224560 [Bacillus thuringiensis serovar aizawai str. Leapi01]|nr:hypothetical protein C621_0224560 [Bacillus thuringiensis serovar aizawai str. Leapi01]ETE98221.1 hypothetical protein C623_0210520 [Bacillus thuringiensis serovar aizawai str. Hu4-2]